MLSIRASPAQQLDIAVGANIPISWPSTVSFPFFPFSFPPCFSDHYLVLSFCYCTALPCWILCPWQESVPTQEQRPDQLWASTCLFPLRVLTNVSCMLECISFHCSPVRPMKKSFFCHYFHELFVCGRWSK